MFRLPELFDRNRRWAEKQLQRDPQFFEHLVEIQRPNYLWIGCADSRVPANEIVGLAPGELFVHRNVANIVRLDDPNAMAVIQYAVETLQIDHVIITGHYGCGGVRAALEGISAGNFVDEWLAPIQGLVARHETELAAISDPRDRWYRLCEWNVVDQVEKLATSAVIRGAWEKGRDVVIHGWIYDLHDGLLKDLGVMITREAATLNAEPNAKR